MNEHPIDWHAAALEMRLSGGPFASALAVAFLYADSSNQAKIKSVFADLFRQFSYVAEYRAKVIKAERTPEEIADQARRRSEDFKFMVLCAAKGNMAMYHMLRDRSLDESA